MKIIDAQPVRASYTLWQMIVYMLRLGSLGFGGPIALVGYMHRDLVEQRGWITEADYKEGLALAQIAPGPLAAQLGIYTAFLLALFVMAAGITTLQVAANPLAAKPY